MMEIRVSGHPVLIDEEDYNRVSKYKWCLMKGSYTFYVRTGKATQLHRFILNAPKGSNIDHIDGNGLNNQKNNLRYATKTENSQNRHFRGGKIPYKGVSLQSKKNKYQARIKVNRREIYLGLFSSAVCAALAYDKAAKKYFGEFANINFSDSWYDKS